MEGNTGFYSVQSNPRTIRTWDLTYKTCARYLLILFKTLFCSVFINSVLSYLYNRAPKYDDQTMFWLVLRTNSNPRPSPLLSCPHDISDHSFLSSNDRVISNNAYDSNNNVS
jgi:hypothetical protein